MRCATHTKKVVTRRFSQVRKLQAKNLTTFETIKILKATELAHKFSVDLYYASPTVLRQLSSNDNGVNYRLATYLNQTLSQTLKNSKDFNNETILRVGNMVRVTPTRVKKTPKATAMVVNIGSRTITIWDKTDPYVLKYINDDGQVVGIENIDVDQNVYGFEAQKKPDVYWAIWYTAGGKNS